MILADKIVRLRKKIGWSQEELAEKMNVSRQAISKWESAGSIPDLNKILKLSEIFGVSTDYLVKDDIEESEENILEDFDDEIRKITLEEAQEYVENKKNAARTIGKGALLSIYAIIPLLLLAALAEHPDANISDEITVAIGVMIMLLIISLGVNCFFRINYYNEDFDKFEKDPFELVYGVQSIYLEAYRAYRPEYIGKMSKSFTLTIISVIPLLIVSILMLSNTLIFLMVVVLLIAVGVGTYIIILTTSEYNVLSLLCGEGEYGRNKRNQKKNVKLFEEVFWPCVLLIYLGWSFLTMDWGVTWIVWPIAALISAVVTSVFRYRKK